jgi:cytochrome c peroxidase
MRPIITVSFVLSSVTLGAALAGCNTLCVDKDCMFTETEWNLVKTMSPLPDPTRDLTNHVVGDQQAETLGRKLLYETRYSTALKVASTLGAVGDTAKVACESCHKATASYVDIRSTPNNMSLGVSWTLRNAPMLVNTVYYDWHNWAGNRRALWEQAGGSPETGTNTAGDRCTYAHMLWDHYRDEYNAVFPETPLPDRLDPAATGALPAKCKPSANPTTMPGPWEAMTSDDKDSITRIMCNQGKAVAAFETLLVSRNAPFDAYVAGTGDISLKAKRGLRLFVGKAACANCHLGSFFTDQKFHNLGIPQTGANVPATDQGRLEAIKELPGRLCKANGPFSDDMSVGVEWLNGINDPDDPTDLGRFRTGSLRNVTQSAPYMHTGGFATLRDVIAFYNSGGEDAGFLGTKDPRIKPLGLSETEIDELIEFLDTLTGEALPGELTSAPQLPP